MKTRLLKKLRKNVIITYDVDLKVFYVLNLYNHLGNNNYKKIIKTAEYGYTLSQAKDIKNFIILKYLRSKYIRNKRFRKIR